MQGREKKLEYWRKFLEKKIGKSDVLQLQNPNRNRDDTSRILPIKRKQYAICQLSS